MGELLDDFDFKADNFTIPSSDDSGDAACLDMASLYSRRPKDLFDNNVVSPACSRLCSCANTKSAPITAAQALPLAAAASSEKVRDEDADRSTDRRIKGMQSSS